MHPAKGKGWGQEPWSQQEMALSDEVVEAAAKRSDIGVVIIRRTAEEMTPFDLVYYPIGEDAVIDVSNVKTERGTETLLGLDIERQGVPYTLTLEMKADASGLAQIPVSIFINKELIKTLTLNGKNGEWLTEAVDIGPFYGRYNYLKLYFGAEWYGAG